MPTGAYKKFNMDFVVKIDRFQTNGFCGKNDRFQTKQKVLII